MGILGPDNPQDVNAYFPQLAALIKGFTGAFLGATQNYSEVVSELTALRAEIASLRADFTGRFDTMATSQEQLTALVQDLQRIETQEEANVANIGTMLTANTTAIAQLDQKIAEGNVDQPTLDLLSAVRDLFGHNNDALSALVPQAQPAPAPAPAPTDTTTPTDTGATPTDTTPTTPDTTVPADTTTPTDTTTPAGTDTTAPTDTTPTDTTPTDTTPAP